MLTKREIQTEKDNISSILLQTNQEEHLFVELYAAQQALAWVLNNSIAKAPLEMIMSTPASSIGCSLECRPPQS